MSLVLTVKSAKKPIRESNNGISIQNGEEVDVLTENQRRVVRRTKAPPDDSETRTIGPESVGDNDDTSNKKRSIDATTSFDEPINTGISCFDSNNIREIPWTESCCPRKVSELPVHSSKVQKCKI